MRSALLLCLPLFAACASTPEPPAQPQLVPAVPADFDPDALPTFDGASGARLDFAGLLERAAAAEVIVIGETHDDAIGHGYQRAVVEALFERFPGSVLALEMLERDEQLLVTDYVAGVLDAEAFARETNSSSWAGEGSWELWYQPIIDAALERGGTVVAANAPRRYVRAARTMDDAQLAALDNRALFDLPFGPQPEAYRERFFELMGAMGHGEPLPSEEIEPIFRAQSIWDATMAASVFRAPTAFGKRVLLIGQFHSDFDGGVLGQLAHLAPELEVLSISLVPSGADVLADEDLGRAHVVVHTAASADV